MRLQIIVALCLIFCIFFFLIFFPRGDDIIEGKALTMAAVYVPVSSGQRSATGKSLFLENDRLGQLFMRKGYYIYM